MGASGIANGPPATAVATVESLQGRRLTVGRSDRQAVAATEPSTLHLTGQSSCCGPSDRASLGPASHYTDAAVRTTSSGPSGRDAVVPLSFDKEFL